MKTIQSPSIDHNHHHHQQHNYYHHFKHNQPQHSLHHSFSSAQTTQSVSSTTISPSQHRSTATEEELLTPLSASAGSNGDGQRMPSVFKHASDERNGRQNVSELISLTTSTTEVLPMAYEETFPIIHGSIEATEMKVKSGNKLQLDNNS